MSVDAVTFAGKISLVAGANKWYMNIVADLRALATALGTDTTTRDTTIQTAPPGLIPGRTTNTDFVNQMLLEINRGKGGNLSNATMAAAITALANEISPPLQPPINVTAPVITYTTGGTGAGTVGAIYAGSVGTWVPTGTPTRQWMRSGAQIPGATAASYTTVTLDGGTNLQCVVTMTNPDGVATANSNTVAIAA